MTDRGGTIRSMSRNTSGLVAGCIAIVGAWLGIAQGLTNHHHREVIVDTALFVGCAACLAYLVHRRRPDADMLSNASRAPGYWRRMKVQMLLLVVSGATLWVLLVGFAVVRTFKYHQPWTLILIPLAVWSLRRLIPAIRRIATTSASDIGEEIQARRQAESRRWPTSLRMPPPAIRPRTAQEDDASDPTWRQWAKEGNSPDGL